MGVAQQRTTQFDSHLFSDDALILCSPFLFLVTPKNLENMKKLAYRFWVGYVFSSFIGGRHSYTNNHNHISIRIYPHVLTGLKQFFGGTPTPTLCSNFGFHFWTPGISQWTQVCEERISGWFQSFFFFFLAFFHLILDDDPNWCIFFSGGSMPPTGFGSKKTRLRRLGTEQRPTWLKLGRQDILVNRLGFWVSFLFFFLFFYQQFHGDYGDYGDLANT